MLEFLGKDEWNDSLALQMFIFVLVGSEFAGAFVSKIFITYIFSAVETCKTY